MSRPRGTQGHFAIAILRSLQEILPPIEAVGCLYVTAVLFGVPFGSHFQVLAAAIAVLMVLILRIPINDTSYLAAERFELAFFIVSRWLLVVALLLAIGYATKTASVFSRKVVLSWAVVAPFVIASVALLLHESMRRILSSEANLRRTLVVGYNESSAMLATRLKANPQAGLSVVGFFDDRSADRLGAEAQPHLLGSLPDLVPFIKANHIDIIFIALPIRHMSRMIELIDQLRDTTASIYYVPDIFVFDLIQARTSNFAGVPVVAMCETPFWGVRGVTKRLVDLLVATTAVIVLSPLMLLIALAVRLTSPGPALFKQRRYGLDGTEILVYKFRTMTVEEDGDAVIQATRDDQRVTPLGRLLRRYSLDELPQLFNVMQGTMSLVGPRPHAVAHNEQYRRLIKGYMVRHKVPPGITGLAQINGCRGETAHLEAMEARIDYDLQYLRSWSLMLDFKILFRTALQLIRGGNAY